METNQILQLFRESLEAINQDRFFSSERGYQGKLLAEIEKKLEIKKILPGEALVEQEYQKRLKDHGIRIRPDIVIHIPYSEGIHSSRDINNFIVIQLKLNASEGKAKQDFSKLDLMFERLNYPLGIFLNINSDRTFYDSYSGNYNDRLHCFSVHLHMNEVVVHESPLR
jgi:hypothetical protein